MPHKNNSHIKQNLITGLVVLIPLIITVYVLVALFRFTDGILGRFLNVFLQKQWGFYVPGIGFLLFFLVVFLVGFLARKYIFKRAFAPLELWFSGLPLIKNIYPAAKQIVTFVSAQKEMGFKKVALVEYPSKGIWSIGFVTNEGFAAIDKTCGKEMLAVFIPTTPGPLSGFVIFLPKDEVRFPDLTITEALNIVISGGVVK